MSREMFTNVQIRKTQIWGLEGGVFQGGGGGGGGGVRQGRGGWGGFGGGGGGGGFTRGEFDGWEFSRSEYSWYLTIGYIELDQDFEC